MKINLSFAFSVLTIVTFAQPTPNLTVTLTGWRDDGRSLPQLFDTIFLNSDFKKTDTIFTNVRVFDTSYFIPHVPTGKHLLLFSAPSHCVAPVHIVVCSKCDNRFVFYASPKAQRDNCNSTFELVELEVSYNHGNRALAKDFFRLLSNKDRKSLKESGDFHVHFYVTKQKAISDISIAPSSLPGDVKNIIQKGLTTLTDWKPAILNGIVSDEEFLLEKKMLYSK